MNENFIIHKNKITRAYLEYLDCGLRTESPTMQTV